MYPSRGTHSPLKVPSRGTKIQPLPLQDVMEKLSQPSALGSIIFTYSVIDVRGSTILHTPWSPRHGFHVKTFSELQDEIPGAGAASGFDMIFTGPNFRIEGPVLNDSDLRRIKTDFNRQLDRTVIEQVGEIIHNNISVHLQILLIKSTGALNVWIF